MIRLRLIGGLLRADPVRHLIVLLSVALGLGFAIGTAATVEGLRQGVSRSATRFPLVVGPRVGPVALVLGTMTRLQDLPASFSYEVFEQIDADPRVGASAPLLGGHGVRGVPILATSAAFLEPRSDFPLSRGRAFEDDKMEAVLGDQAARSLGLEPGDSLDIEHAHEGAPLEAASLLVTGVLEPRSDEADDTVFCPVEAIFHSHGSHDGEAEVHEEHSVSAVLLRPVDDAALLSLQEDLLGRPGIEVALTGQTLRRVVDQLSGGTRLLSLLVTGIGAVTFLTLALGLYELGRSWTRAVAVLRVMGASRREVLTLVVGTASVLVAVGVGSGILVGFGIGAIGARYLSSSLGMAADPVFLAPGVLRTLAVFAGLFLLSILQPILSATRREVSLVLRGQVGERRTSYAGAMRFLVPALLFVAANAMMAKHDAEGVSLPPDTASLEVFASIATWRGEGPVPDRLSGLEGQKLRIEGYMMARDPYSTADFSLVAQNPDLPRCPFCYRAPTRWERIRVRGPQVDVAKGLVVVEGTLRLDADGADPCGLEMTSLDVVLDAGP